MSETAFEKAYLRRSYTRTDMSWSEFWFWVVIGFVVLVFATLLTFGPFPPTPVAHAAEIATTTPMTDQQIAHQADKDACTYLALGEPTIGGHRSRAEDYCNKYGK